MDGELDAPALAGLIADETRLKVVGALALGATSPQSVAAATGISVRAAGKALTRLETAGLIRREGSDYAIDYEYLVEVAREAVATRPAEEDVDPGSASAVVLRRFFKGGRLTAIPVARQKRLAVLDFLAGQFEPGKVYPERDVNTILGQYNEDTAALRRYMVDEGFFERREGFYWRAGGTFEVDPGG
jgi:DNA-binding transcriptional ArsR family regulator